MVCPLDWGLGHAARMIPVIKLLIEAGTDVIVAADKGPLKLLNREFPQVQSVVFPGMEIKYSTRGSQAFAMFLQSPKFIASIRKENRFIQELIQKYEIDIVISDNRYGAYSGLVHSILVTHQLMLKMTRATKWMEKKIHHIIKSKVEKFDECWIPDYKDDQNLSGDLSHMFSLPSNAKFIGPLSRFTSCKHTDRTIDNYDIVAIISGPEPQRSQFEQILTHQLGESGIKSIIVRGKPGEKKDSMYPNLHIVDHMETQNLVSLLNSAKYVICRSGYSSVMDMFALHINAIMVPTPGQTEQEYLANHLQNKYGVLSCKQRDFDIENVLSLNDKCHLSFPTHNNHIAKNIIEELV